MKTYTRLLQLLLFLITVAGNALVLNAVHLLFSHYKIVHFPILIELSVMGLAVSPWSVKMPSGASWRPGIPLMMMSLFLVKPAAVVIVPVPGLVLITARARGSWKKYFETIAHVALGLYTGTWTYVGFSHFFHGNPWSRTLALIPALIVHLLVNRLISAVIVANRDQRTLYTQVKMTLRELHWGYFNSYILIVLASMVDPRYLPIGMLVIAILQIGVFLAVSHYSRIETLQKSVWADGLTNLENRSAWERLRDGERGNHRDRLVCVVDVNNFKDFNDKHGHLVGDDVLRGVAHVLKSVSPRTARIFRVGGDEFVLVLPRYLNIDLATLIREGISQSSLLNQLDEKVSISVGLAAEPEDGLTLTDLFRVADRRMYEEKRSTRYTESGMDFGVPASVLSLILAVESKDPYTSGHNLRVAFYAWQLASHLNVEPSLMKSIFRAGLVHDVGKIGIPDAILNKPGKLTPEEMRIVQQHPVIGFEMCRKLDFAKSELDAIHHHHERWDGNGYPLGLQGDAIPLSARILAVADIYDALTSVRSYRTAWSHSETLEYIAETAGRQLDPVCVEHWVALNQTKGQQQQFIDWVKQTNLDQVSATIGLDY